MKVIHPVNMPSKLPLWPTLLAWLWLDYLGWPTALTAVLCTLAGLVWLGTILAICTEERVRLGDSSDLWLK